MMDKLKKYYLENTSDENVHRVVDSDPQYSAMPQALKECQHRLITAHSTPMKKINTRGKAGLHKCMTTSMTEWPMRSSKEPRSFSHAAGRRTECSVKHS